MIFFCIGLGGALGAISRFVISTWFNSKDGFPYGTLCANAIGCFLLGLLGIYLSTKVHAEWRAFISTGFLGALTTFSTFSLETIQFAQRDQWKLAITYFLVQLITGLCLGLLGIKISQHFMPS